MNSFVATTRRRKFITDAGVVVLIISLSVVVLFHRLGESSLHGDETIYAQVSSEAVFEGRWLPPTYLGTVHKAKPPLKMWIVAGFIAAFGKSAFAARLADALLGMATLLLVYLFGKGRFGRAASACGAVMLLAAHQFVFHHGLRSSVQEGAVVFLGTIMLFNWLQVASVGDGRRRSLAPATVAGGLLGFIKNPLGAFFAVILVAQAGIETVVRGRWREGLLGQTLVVTVVAVSCWIAWIVYMGLVTGGHYYEYLVRDVVERSVEGFPKHIKPADFYVRSLWADFGSWWLFAIPAGWSAWQGARTNARDTDRAALHVLLWIALIVAAFSMSASKLSWYVYPVYPAIALFLGLGVSRTATTLADIAGSGFHRLMWVVVAAMLTIQMAAAWRVADQDRVMQDMHRFAEAYRTLPDATISVDYKGLRRQGLIRSWNVYHLYWLPGVRWNEVSRPDAAGSDCRFAVVADTRPYLAEGWQLILTVRERDPRAVPLPIVGTCSLDLPPGGGRNPGMRRDDLQQAWEAVRSWTGLKLVNTGDAQP